MSAAMRSRIAATLVAMLQAANTATVRQIAAALALRKIADELGARRRGLVGRQLCLTPR
jgi:hypothetical protein